METIEQLEAELAQLDAERSTNNNKINAVIAKLKAIRDLKMEEAAAKYRHQIISLVNELSHDSHNNLQAIRYIGEPELEEWDDVDGIELRVYRWKEDRHHEGQFHEDNIAVINLKFKDKNGY